MKYLLDTNICSYIVSRRPPAAYERFQQESFREIAVSTITLSELFFGVTKSMHPERNEVAYRSFLEPLTVLDFAAAHARSRNLTPVTNNERDFARVDGLTLENWIK